MGANYLTIKQYRKKPVVIEAIQFLYTKERIQEIRDWAGAAIGHTTKARCIEAKGEMQIGTLEDGKVLTVKHIATEGDFIIKGVQGELYACKPDIFEQTYEEIQ